jgi:hypothetical protein
MLASWRGASAGMALAVLIGACRYEPSPVELQGAPADISALAGSWSGEYVGFQSGRSGFISLTVNAGSDTAWGEVVMTPARQEPVVAVDAASHAHLEHARASEVLRIMFVRVSGGLVQGSLEPYIAPDCRCAVSTTFRGAVQGKAIKGDFVTTGEFGLKQTGSWSLSRR